MSNEVAINRNIRIGELLVRDGTLTSEMLDKALEFQKSQGGGKKIGDILIEQGYVKEDAFIQALHKQLGVPIADVEHAKADTAALSLIPKDVALKYTILPLSGNGENMVLAMYNPIDFYAIDDIELMTRRKVRSMLAKKSDILRAIERIYPTSISSGVIERANKEFRAVTTADDYELTEINDRVNNAPMVQLVNAVLNQAHKLRSSDVHIEPMEDRVRIRFRVDGELLEVMSLNLSVLNGLVTRVKIMADMDIAERRIPQDGRFSVEIGGREIHTRVASMPSVFGEKLVIRMLGDASADVRDITELGMRDYNYKRFLRMLAVPSGILLVTGPTGSGKTTTLYSSLKRLAKPSTNIVSIEDPVEKTLPGINQMQINVKAGLTFASGLRALLRQDPDIIMLGEIRDAETAQIASRAAITGHLVLSTLHTNDAASSFSRLVDMGVEPYIVSSAMIGVASQRLVKKLCPKCKRERTITENEAALIPELQAGERVFEPVGCPECNETGYLGRTAVHEIAIVTGPLRSLISKNADIISLRAQIEQDGCKPLRLDLLDRVREGVTSVNQLIKTTYSLD